MEQSWKLLASIKWIMCFLYAPSQMFWSSKDVLTEKISLLCRPLQLVCSQAKLTSLSLRVRNACGMPASGFAELKLHQVCLKLPTSSHIAVTPTVYKLHNQLWKLSASKTKSSILLYASAKPSYPAAGSFLVRVSTCAQTGLLCKDWPSTRHREQDRTRLLR